MVLTPHIIVGAAIGAKTQNLGLIVILALVIHIAMDKIPHWDYHIPGLKNFKKTKDFKALFTDFGKMAIDGLLGMLIVFFILWYRNILNSNYLPFILFAIFISLLPDLIYGSIKLFTSKSFAEKYRNFHYKILHRQRGKEKEGKITFLGLSTEILTTIIAVIILLL